MGNILERHPGYTLLIVIVTVMTATWGVLTFVLGDNKINFYKAQVESVKAETENIKSVNSQYQARINYLEGENEKLTKLNETYLEWIAKSSAPLPFFKKQVEDLTAENLKLSKQSKDTSINNINIPGSSNNTLSKYNIITNINKAQAYIDDTTRLIIGVTDIDVTYATNLQITFPDKTVINDKASAGKVYNFKVGKRSYQAIIKKVEYIYSYVTVQILEV